MTVDPPVKESAVLLARITADKALSNITVLAQGLKNDDDPTAIAILVSASAVCAFLRSLEITIDHVISSHKPL